VLPENTPGAFLMPNASVLVWAGFFDPKDQVLRPPEVIAPDRT